jgi:hypothetical protein
MCAVITVAIVMLLIDFGPYGIISMAVCLLLYIFPSFVTGTLLVFTHYKFLRSYHKN